jgi:hypothetical protein
MTLRKTLRLKWGGSKNKFEKTDYKEFRGLYSSPCIRRAILSRRKRWLYR